MAEEKTRIIPRNAAAPQPVEPRVVNGQIVFFCPAGHRLAVPVHLGGKRGKCGKCGVFLQIPLMEAEQDADAEAESAEAGAEEEAAEPEEAVGAEAAGEADASGSDEPHEPIAETAPEEASADAGGWNFVADEAGVTGAATEGAAWSASDGGLAVEDGGESNPTARLVTRLWAERNHGGIIELHLVGGNVILPEEFAARWSRGTHGLFASQAADGTVTLTAVAWDTIQRIVVRQLAAVPDDMFE